MFSKHNSNREKQVILLMVSNEKNAELSSKDDPIEKYLEIKIFVIL